MQNSKEQRGGKKESNFIISLVRKTARLGGGGWVGEQRNISLH